MTYNNFCLSSYLTFRYVVKKGVAWKENITPIHSEIQAGERFKIKDSEDVLKRIKRIVQESTKERTGLLLSGGIDSAILAAFVPPGTRAYTIRFRANKTIDESKRAKTYSEKYGLEHKIVDVSWGNYLKYSNFLMESKKSPLHPVEIGLYMASRQAAKDSITSLIVGNGADSTFGGMDKLLSKDWTLEGFIKRYTFVDPKIILKYPVSMKEFYEKYKEDGKINVIKFLKELHGVGIIQAFENAIHSGGCKVVAPYEKLILDAPLDLKKIRGGESKYILRKIFKGLYPNLEIPRKIPFARPMGIWLKDWLGPKRQEFKKDIDISQFSGDQKYLIFCLERFMNLMENK